MSIIRKPKRTLVKNTTMRTDQVNHVNAKSEFQNNLENALSSSQ